MTEKWTRRGALALVGSGAAMVAWGAGGFTTTTADRNAVFDTAADPSALLGIDGYQDTSTSTTFENNATNSMEVTLDSDEPVVFDVGPDGSYSASVAFSLAVGGTEEVNIRWVGDDCTNADSAVVDTIATLEDGSGNTTGSISFDRTWVISESGQVAFSGTAKSAGSSGKYEFELENTGCTDVTFVGIGINETTATDADYVSGGGSLYNLDTGDELVTDRIPIDNSNPNKDIRRDMEPEVTLPVGDTVDFEFRRFERDIQSGKSSVDMRGEDVRITLYLSDGSSAVEKLCLDGCSF